MSTTDTEVSNLIINKLTLSKYKELKTAGTLSETESYEITDIDTAIETGSVDAANRSLSNLNAEGKNIANWSSSVTNCITEIPQDIKLELKDGTLTLKAGSKVYVPNGFESNGTTPKFDEVVIASDKVINATGGSGKGMICVGVNRYGATYGYGATSSISNCVSGDGVTPVNYGMCYDTTTNIIQRWGNGVVSMDKASFPLAIVTLLDGVITSIDQVFNGFGYIGSTVFALPGVKGLIPNGRNTDGSLNNIEFTTNRVRIYTFNLTWVRDKMPLSVNENGSITSASYVSYDYGEVTPTEKSYLLFYNTKENLMYQFMRLQDNVTIVKEGIFGEMSLNNGIISLKPKTAFHAVDYNDYACEVDNTVHKTGDENFSGTKTMLGTRFIFGATDLGKFKEIEAQSESSKVRIGILRFTNGSDGISRKAGLSIVDNNNKNQGGFEVGINSNGKAYTIASTPESTSNSNDIATTSWTNNKFKVVSTLPANPDANTFYFVTN